MEECPAAWLYSTLAEHRVEITEMLAEDDRVVFWGDTSGLHSGEVEGIPLDNLNLIKQFGITITRATI